MIRKLRNWYILASVIMLALGLFILIKPETSLEFIAYIFGAFLIFQGAFKMFGYFSDDLYRLDFPFDFALGLLSILFGSLLLIKPEWLMQYVTILIGIYMVVDSLFMLQTAIESKQIGIKRWWLVLLMAIIACVLGILLVLNAWQWAIVLSWLLGVNLIIMAIRNLFIAVDILHDHRSQS